MRWIHDLVKPNCFYCQKRVDFGELSCRECSARRVENSVSNSTSTPIVQDLFGMPVVSAFKFEGWIRDQILKQKTNPKRVVVKWFSEELWRTCPEKWRNHTFAWVPGRPLSEIHLVEMLADELQHSHARLSIAPVLNRKLNPTLTPFKFLNRESRLNQDLSKRFSLHWAAKFILKKSPQVVLIDDIVTTGSTLAGLKQLIESQTNAAVVGGLTLAATPSYLSNSSSADSSPRTSG